ncbi:Lrp/AsnC family transcriptional regulator [Devosia sp.]|uniref:Lrp/AsnC family transcriptional regulator n=1 Tax=Devosia sp. TaxID=1871048 RepID=UPI0035AFC281
MATGLDEIDYRLLDLLQDDDRLPVAELGKILGVAPSTLNDRIRRLVKQGVITGFHARVDPEKVGLDLLAFIYVGWSDPATEQRFLAAIARTPEVIEAHHVTGAWNYLMKVRLRTTRDLEGFLAGVLKEVPGLQRTETQIVLSSPKQTCRVGLPRG